MARRKKSRAPRRRFTGINALDAAQTYAQAAVWTDVLFNNTPIDFALSTQGSGSGSSKINLKELVNSVLGGAGGVHPGTASAVGVAPNAFGMIQHNLKGQWVEATIKSVGIGIGFKVAKKALAAPRRNLNKLTRNLGMGQMIRF